MQTQETSTNADFDPVRFLRTEFARRAGRNPRYSLRSFALSLGVSHTVLSLVFSGRRRLSKKAAELIANRLELGGAERALFLRRSEPAEIPTDEKANLALETFELISDWTHYAILSLLETPEAKWDARWISSRLHIGEMSAKLAMERLVRLGLVEKDAKKRWRQKARPLKIENSVSTVATRKFQRQLLEKAIDSLETDPVAVRDFSSMTLAMDPVQIPYAIERIRQFRRQLTAELESRGKPREVYNLTVQIYPVSKRRSE